MENDIHKRNNIFFVCVRTEAIRVYSCHKSYSWITHDQRVITYDRKAQKNICCTLNAPPQLNATIELRK